MCIMWIYLTEIDDVIESEIFPYNILSKDPAKEEAQKLTQPSHTHHDEELHYDLLCGQHEEE